MFNFNKRKMPESVRAYFNRCRCCLEKFYEDERTSKITNFFEIQYSAFTSIDLRQSEMLSKHVCEFCHTELLRFSVFKKDLIEKQQKLNELLKQYEERETKPTNTQTSYTPKAVLIPKVNLTSEDELEIYSEREEEDSMLSDLSDDENDRDYEIVCVSRASEPPKPYLKKKKTPLRREPDPSFKFVCDFCESTFKAKQGLTRHVQSHILNSIPWKCNHASCHFACSSKIKLNLHKFEVHDVPMPQTSNSDRLIREKREKLAVVVDFSCFCGASFASMFSLRAHKNRLHGRKNKCIYGCANVQYIKTGHFIRHIQAKHPEKLEEVLKKAQIEKTPKLDEEPKVDSTNPVYQCDKCDFDASKKSSLKCHIESHLSYEDREFFECDKCLKQFARATSLRAHQQHIHEAPVQKHICPKCPKVSFKQLSELDDHVAFKHGTNRKSNFKCGLCDRSYLKHFMLVRHQNAVHKFDQSKKMLKVERKFKCNCGKDFLFKSRLIKHKKKHDPRTTEVQKRFKCPFKTCDHSFTQRCNLLRHQRMKGHGRDDRNLIIVSQSHAQEIKDKKSRKPKENAET